MMEKEVLREYRQEGTKVELAKYADHIHGESHDVIIKSQSGDFLHISFEDETAALEVFLAICAAKYVF